MDNSTTTFKLLFPDGEWLVIEAQCKYIKGRKLNGKRPIAMFIEGEIAEGITYNWLSKMLHPWGASMVHNGKVVNYG